MRFFASSPFGAPSYDVLLDRDLSYALPSGPQPLGTSYFVMDNLGLGNAVTIIGLFAGGTVSLPVSASAGWGMRFTWGGSFYVVG